MTDIINKWTHFINKDILLYPNITYDRKILNEMLTDFKNAISDFNESEKKKYRKEGYLKAFTSRKNFQKLAEKQFETEYKKLFN